MLRASFLIISLVTIVSVMGCIDEAEDDISDDDDRQDFVTAILDTKFQLRVNETAFIESENIKITFLDVTEDSRCPIDVVCVWEGQAKVLINVVKDDQDSGAMLTLTERSGNDDLATAVFHNYSVKLVQVQPYPISTEAIELSDYIISLIITKL